MKREEARQKAKALVSQMTLDEAASQLRFDSPAVDRLGVPAYNWWNEALHGIARGGTATSFPQAIGMAATFDPELVEQLGDVASTEGRARYNTASAHGDRDIYKGLTFWSPNINIFRDPRWGRGHETYGEDPYLTGEMGTAYVHGLQGKGDVLKAAACAKHFAVHSGPESLRHKFNAVVNAKDLNETYLPAFKKLVENGVEAVMGAYNRTNGEPCCANKPLMKKLRGDWGFQGHFVSDCWAISDFHTGHMVTSTPEESATLALKTGCDVNCGDTYRYAMKAYEKGMITEVEIRQAAERLFTTRYMLGLFDGSEYDSIPYEVMECREHLQKAEKAAQEACVLLKNNGILPLNKEKLKTIGVIGPNANSRIALMGNYHGTSSRYITVLEGIQNAVGDDVRVFYSEGSSMNQEHVEGLGMPDDRVSEALTVAEHSDVVILVVGLDEKLEGEEGDAGTGDKGNLLLPKTQRVLMDAVLAAGKPVVICLMAGSSIDLGEAADKADAVLLTWYPGARGGKTAADILFGKISPSGKLPVTFYHNAQLDTMPEFTDYSMAGRTYRYLESEPLYPFGYGLTYGDCQVTGADYAGGTAKVSIRNNGLVDTWEVAQVYCQEEGSAFAPRNPHLCGFRRVFCPAGETVNAEIPVDEEQFKVFNDEGEKIRDGKVVLYVGLGQPDKRTEALTGHASIRVEAE